MIRSTFFPALFVAACGVELAAVQQGWTIVHWVAKSLIVPSLVGYYFVNVDVRSSRVLTALLFCWAGDILLMFQAKGEIFFMLGLAAFLFGHIAYILAYRELRWQDAPGLSQPQKIRFSLPVILIGAGLLGVLFPNLGGLRVPVFCYAVALVMMVMFSIFRMGMTTNRSFVLVFVGASMFMISDSLIALNKFYSPVPNASLWVMSTYVVAQYLIIRGIIAHEPAEKEKAES